MIKLKKVLKNGGATLDNNGVYSQSLSGYMVSLIGYEEKTAIDQLNDNKLNNIINRYKKIAKSVGGYIGLWIDNNILYSDISINILDYNEALALGKKYSQLAIYDIKNNKSVEVIY